MNQQEQDSHDTIIKIIDILHTKYNLHEDAQLQLTVTAIIIYKHILETIPSAYIGIPIAHINKVYSDGNMISNRLYTILNDKGLSVDNIETIISILDKSIKSENINIVVDGKPTISQILIDIMTILKSCKSLGLSVDFTGKLYSLIYKSKKFSEDKHNDIVLTPPYVAKLLARLANINKDSRVLDLATGSGGLIISAIDEMVDDIDTTTKRNIKHEQIIGIELSTTMYMLSIVNMILMDCNVNNIKNTNSLLDPNDNLGLTSYNADTLILNPPYSVEGNGMIFAEKGMDVMSGGYTSIIIQSSAGHGKAVDINKRILRNNTLIASIKMPLKTFIGYAELQTNIYVFNVGRPHKNVDLVKFIDFSDDGYSRSGNKSKLSHIDTNRAKDRYDELALLVRFGKSELNIFTDKEYYENTINLHNGADWNQSAPIDTKPTLEDFRKTIKDYLLWEVSNIIKGQGEQAEENNDSLGK